MARFSSSLARVLNLSRLRFNGETSAFFAASLFRLAVCRYSYLEEFRYALARPRQIFNSSTLTFRNNRIAKAREQPRNISFDSLRLMLRFFRGDPHSKDS